MLQSTLSRILAVVAVVAVVLTGVLLVVPSDGQKHISAAFPRAVSLYDGSDVRILGVSVGTVDSVRPAGDHVIVKLSYDAKYKLPDDAKVALVSPSIVGDRFLQLTPVYKSGAVLADNVSLGTDRTAVPLELDEIYGSLNDLSKALGPDGVNATNGQSEGALTRLLDSTARNFGGQGAQFNTTLKNLARLTTTLANHKDDLFGTARELETFINTLAKNDTTVRAFNDSLASAADLLAGERNDLAAALRNLGTALLDVKGFVQDNKTILTKDIKGLNSFTKVIVKRRAALDSVLRDAPLALNNLALAYNPKIGVLNTRANSGEGVNQLSADPAAFICGAVSLSQGPTKECQDAVSGLSLPRAGALKVSSTPDDPHRYVDQSLAGLAEVK